MQCVEELKPRFLRVWPNARISVMGGIQHADVLYTIKLDQRRNKNLPVDDNELEDIRKSTLEKFEEEGHHILFKCSFMG